MHEAISQIEQKEVETPRTAGLLQCLDLHYEEDFLEKQSHQIPAVFSDQLFIPSMANVVYKVVKPPVVPKTFPSASGCKVPSVSSQPEDGGPEPEVSEPKESAPSAPKPSQQVQERSLRLPTLTQIRLMSLPQRRNSLLKVSKSKFPLDS